MRTLQSRSRALPCWGFSPRATLLALLCRRREWVSAESLKAISCKAGSWLALSLGGRFFPEEEDSPGWICRLSPKWRGHRSGASSTTIGPVSGLNPMRELWALPKRRQASSPALEYVSVQSSPDRVEPDAVDAEPNPRKQGDNDNEK